MARVQKRTCLLCLSAVFKRNLFPRPLLKEILDLFFAMFFKCPSTGQALIHSDKGVRDDGIVRFEFKIAGMDFV